MKTMLKNGVSNYHWNKLPIRFLKSTKPIQPVKKPTAPTEDVCFVSVDEPVDHNATTKSSPKAVQNPKPNNSPKVYVQNSKTSSTSKVTIEKPKQSAEQTTVFVDDWIKNKSPYNAPKLVENVTISQRGLKRKDCQNFRSRSLFSWHWSQQYGLRHQFDQLNKSNHP